MSRELTIAQLAGDKVIRKVTFFSFECGRTKPAYTVGKMFSKPYDMQDKRELYFTLQRLLAPAVCGLLSLSFLPIAVLFPITLATLGAITHAISTIIQNQDWKDFLCDRSVDLTQCAVDILVAPLTSLVLLTRAISTAFNAFRSRDSEYCERDHGSSFYISPPFDPSDVPDFIHF